MDLGLKGKVALVTGAGSPIGFGRAISLTLAKEGCDIIVNDIDLPGAKQTTTEINDLGRKAIPVKADISNKAEVNDMVNTAYEQFGRIDILVNNASMGLAGKPFLEITDEEWDLMINVNFRGTVYVTRAVLPGMIKQKSGKIINIASNAGKTGVPTASMYAATKAAVVSITKSLSIEVGPLGINVNGIAPGTAKTNLERYATPEFVKMASHLPPIGRLTVPQDIANMVAFLASDAASDIAGQTYSVDGGHFLY
jgi:NAD(P)-dependent dehydrogenase (short-subunit alcohol dehydrogenase family)